MASPLFEVRGLSVALHDAEAAARGVDHGLVDPLTERRLPAGWIPALHDVSFSVAPGEVLAVVGESGMGKTLAMLGALGLLGPSARVLAGDVVFRGERFDSGRLASLRDEGGRRKRRRRRWMTELDDPVYARIMGNDIGIVFQDAIAAWDPVFMIGDQAGEVLEEHTDMPVEEIRDRVLDILGEVRLPKHRKYVSFASELSRGEAQRAMLAAALVKGPSLLVADEPFSGLDPPVAQGISQLIGDMQRRRGLAMVMVNHNLAQVASLADRVAVIYGGRVVEEASVEDVYHRPRHPYTEGILGSVPWPGVDRLRPVPGEVPRLIDMGDAECPFAARCVHVEASCHAGVPELTKRDGSVVRCGRADELELRGVGR